MSTAVVTGGAGFIGSHVADKLLAAGTAVVAVDDLSTGKRENVAGAGVELEVADVRDADAMRALLERVRPDVVYHLAAQISVTRSVGEVEYDADVNVRGTATLLEAARRAEVPRFVYVSTGGALYGDADVVPTPEGSHIQPLAPYGLSKWVGERYCDLYRALHAMSTLTLRLANIYGPRQDPHGEAGVVAIFCQRLHAGEPAVVFGDGRQTRDYTYVGDVADAVLAAGASDATGAVNIGRGEESSVLDLVDTLRALSGGDGFQPEHAPERPGEARRSCLDPARAREALDWTASTSLRDGLDVTLRSFAP
ncbi:MAG TPA: NAD-dependent epimerase/dehydratase family protein [Solirubrobacteraceae bacterium]|nr:NAD-dependent epimerase/dehydratase family protein [Solirubrobacteraceae bacterium]